MADSDSHREVVRLRQELKIWEDRCSKLAKEKEQCSDSVTQLTIRIRELEAEVEHLQSVVQQIKTAKEAEILDLKQQKNEIELRLQQLLADDIQDGVPILANIASTSAVMSALEVSELKLQAPVTTSTFNLRSIYNALIDGRWKGIDRLCDLVRDFELETDEDNVILWHPGTAWKGHPWKYCLRVYLMVTPDMAGCISTFNQEIFPSLRCACQDGGCHLVNCVMDTTVLDNLLENKDDLITEEVKHSDVVVIFLGNAVSTQVKMELNALLTSGLLVKAVLVCTNQQGRVPESYSSEVVDLQKRINNFKVIHEFDDSKEKCDDVLETLKNILKHECCVPSIPRISEDLAVSRIGILQDMKIEQEQVELVQSYTSKKDLIGVAFCFDQLQEYLHSDPTVSTSPFMLRSWPGEGKSSLLVRWLSEISDEQIILLDHFVTSSNSASSQPEVMYRRFVQKLQYYYPESPSCPTYSHSENVLKEFFLKSLGHAAAKCLGKAEKMQILIVIDNADRVENCSKSLDWLLGSLPLCVKIVMSVSLPSYPKDWSVLQNTDIPIMNAGDTEETIQEEFGNVLEDYQIGYLMENGPDNPYPRLWYILAMHHILSMLKRKAVTTEDRDDVVDELIGELESCHETHSLLEHILTSLDESLGSDGDYVYLILQFICQSSHGLTLQELLELTSVPYSLWCLVFKYLKDLQILIEVGGLVQFAHPMLKEAVQGAIYFTGNDIGLAQRFLAYYKNPEGPPVHISRMLEELPRHLILLKQEQELKSLLSNVEVLIFMVFSGSYCKLMSMWKSIGIDKDDMVGEYLMYMSVTEGEEHADNSHTAHLWQQLGVFLRTIQDHQRSKQCLERGLELYEAYFDPDSPQVARSVYELGVLYIAWKKPQTAEGLLQQALGSFEEAYGPDSWECLRVLKALKTVKEILNDNEMAVSLESEIVRVQNIVMTQPQNSTSVKAIRKLIKKLESEIEEVETVGTASALHELGTLYAIMSDLENSIVYYGHALNIRESLLGDFHIETVCTLFNMGQVASYQNKFDISRVLWEKTFKSLLQMSSLQDQHSIMYDVIEQLFAVYMAECLYQNAEAVQRVAVDLIVKEFGQDHELFAKAMNNYGIVLAHQGQFKYAKKCLENSQSILQRKVGEVHPSIAANLQKLDKLLHTYKEEPN